MVDSKNEIPHISSIFQRNVKGYDKDAMLYQDILLFPFKTGVSDFKFWPLGYWLIGYNKEFREYYGRDKDYSSKTKTKPRNAVLNRRDRIIDRLTDLKMLQLVKTKEVKAEKLDYNIEEYSLTLQGYLIALLVAREHENNKKRRDQINAALYKFAISLLSLPDSASFLVFARMVYERCYNEGLIETVFDSVRDRLLSDTRIRSIFHVLTSVIIGTQTDEYNKRLFRICYQTLQSLDQHSRKIILFALKSTYEGEIAGKYPGRSWEQERIKNMHNEKILTLQGLCSACNYICTIPISSEKFFGHIWVRKGYPTMNCIRCDGKGTVEISDRFILLDPDPDLEILEGLPFLKGH